MASTINATSVGSGGLISTGDDSGQLELQTDGTTRVTLDSLGHAVFAGDVTVNGNLNAKTPLALVGDSNAGAEIRLPEDTDNGTNYVALRAPSSLASNLTFTLPSADGTSGQVIQTNGSGVLSFATPAGGAWTYLSTVSASGAATADVESTFSSTYDQYAIIGSNVVGSTGGQDFMVRMKIGGSYITTATYGRVAIRLTAASSTIATDIADDNASAIRMAESVAALSSRPFNFIMYVSNPSSTSVVKNVFWHGNFSYDTTSQAVFFSTGAGRNTGTDALTGVRFYLTSGNISGTFRLYGIKNS